MYGKGVTGANYVVFAFHIGQLRRYVDSTVNCDQ
jgi:hypothetical protein